MLKSIITILVVIILFAGGVLYYVYNKPHRDINEEEASLEVTSVQLFNQYSDNEKMADSTYLNKVVKVSGVISEIGKDQKGERYVVMKEDDDIFGVVCSMDETDLENQAKAEAMKVGDTIILKGVCTGFADDVKLNKCFLLK